MDATLTQSSSFSERILAAAGVAAVSLCSAAVWWFDPRTTALFPACPLLKLTGIACPGCGMTRGFHALFNGDVLAALDYNAILPVFTIFGGYLLLSMISVAARGRGVDSGKKYAPYLLWSTLAVLAVFGVVRNLPFYPFTILMP